jgi:hypothetical protein
MNKIYKFNYHWLNELSKHKDMLDNDTRILVTYIEVLQQENQQLKEELEEYERIEQEDLKAFNNYESILTELEEWLKTFHKNSEFEVWEITRKIQELKEKYK